MVSFLKGAVEITVAICWVLWIRRDNMTCTIVPAEIIDKPQNEISIIGEKGISNMPLLK